MRADIRDGGIDPANLGKGDWIYILANAQNNLYTSGYNTPTAAVTNLSSLMEFEKNMGCRYLIIKSADGTTRYPSDANPQFTSAVVNAGHAAGLYVFAYDYVYGSNVPSESNMVNYAFGQGADGVVFDAEGEFQALPNNGAAATSLCGGARARWPNKFFAYSTFPIISSHTPFPYKEFGYYCDVAMPQDYWNDGQLGALVGYSPTTMEQRMTTEWSNWQNSLSGIWLNSIKPIVPTAQGWNESGYPVTAAQIQAFVNALETDPNPATAGGYQGVNYWRAEIHPAEIFDAMRTNCIGNCSGYTVPVIANVTVASLGATNVTLTFTTDQSSDSEAEWGMTSLYGIAATNPPQVWYHIVTLTNLSPDTTYHYRVRARNVNNFVGLSPDGVFTTLSTPVADVTVESCLPGGSTETPYPPYTDSGFPGSSSCKSTAGGLSATSSRYATGGSGTPSVTLRPTLAVAGGTYKVSVTHCSTSCSANIVVSVGQSGGTGLPSTTALFQSQYANVWTNVGQITLNAGVTVPTVTFTYSSGTLDSSDRMYSDGYKFVYVPPPPSPPSIATQPQSQSLTPGSTALFTVVASGTAPLNYQWRLNGAPIDGATDSIYTKYDVQTNDAGSYSVVITNSVGPTNSLDAVLTVLVPPTIVAEPEDVVTGLGLDAAFSVTAVGTPPLSYQWQFNGTNITQGTTSTLTIPAVQATNAGPYTVTVSSTNGIANSSIAFLIVQDPYITSQPGDQNVEAGATANFSVSAVGTPTLGYQWFKEGVPLSSDGQKIIGAQSSSLAVANVQATDMAYYSVVVSNANGWVASSNAALTGPFPPHIWPQPASQKVVAGSTASFTVTALGPGLSYQWRRAGTNLVDGGKISGASSANLVVANVEAGEVGNYSVAVTNTYGYAVSADAILSEWPLAAWGYDNYGQTDIPAGLTNVVGIASGNSHSLALNLDGTVVGWGAGTNYTGSGAYFGQANPPVDLTNAVAIAGGGYHSLALKADGTVVAWGAGTNYGVSPRFGQAIVPEGLANVVAIAGGLYHSLALKADGTVAAWGAGTNSGSSAQYGQSVVPADLSNVVAIACGSYHSLALKADGTVEAWGAGTTNTGTLPHYGQSMVPASLSNVVAIACGGYHSLAVKADGTVVAWGAGTTNTGTLPHYGQSMVPSGLSNVVEVTAGTYYSVALRADGTMVGWGLSNYGQTNIPAGLADVVAVAGGGSHELALQNDGSPCILHQPASQTATAGSTLTLLVSAVGFQPMTFQWQHDETNLIGATSATLTLTNVQSADAGNYAVVVSNLTGTLTSSSAVLSVQTPARITAQPASQTVILGRPATFTVGAEGDPPLSYQWRLNSAAIDGATASVYAISDAQVTNEGTYTVVVTNAFGAAESSNATLTVLVAPDIVTPPTNQVVIMGAEARFTVVASGSEPLSYQWYFNQTNVLEDATTDTLSRPNAEPADAGSYTVVITNSAGSITSLAATLTVNVPPAISAQPQSACTNAGADVTFSVTASGTEPLGYQWRLNGGDIPGALACACTRLDAQTNDAGSYTVVVSNMAGAVTSAEAVLTITTPPGVHIDAITLAPEQGIQLQVSGGPGNFAIDITTNLSDWNPLSNVTATTPVFQFTDPDTNQPSRFYRVRGLQ